MLGRSQNPVLSWPGLVLVALVAGGFYLSRVPLRSSRPAAPVVDATVRLGEEQVDARLWEDPLRAVFDHRHSENTPAAAPTRAARGPAVISHHTVYYLSNNINRLLSVQLPDQPTADKAGPRLQVLLTMVPGGSTAEDHERRLRSRQAMHAALRASGYAPEDSDHIGYFDVRWFTAQEIEAHAGASAAGQGQAGHRPGKWHDAPISFVAEGQADGVMSVPFEWFRAERIGGDSTSAHAPHAVVLWLADEEFADHPLIRLAQLCDALHRGPPSQEDLQAESGTPRQPFAWTNGDAAKPKVKFNLIGPYSSTIVREMQAEQPEIMKLSPLDVGSDATVDVRQRLQELTIYSPSSTAVPKLLLSELPSIALNEDGDMHFDAVTFHRTIGTDDQLAKQLVDELERRGIFLRGTNAAHQVALISEWDSSYGRAFPLTFAAHLRVSSANDGACFHQHLDYLLAHPEDFPTNLHNYSYFRGVDGQVPRRGKGEDEPAKESTLKEAEPPRTGVPEAPIGRSQLDYVRRLARQLAEDYRRTGETANLKAIGIVGSDVYDKLLLLQALHEEFTDVVFFTTDLDARLFHYSQLKWTRNLIVASHYQLQLRREYQRGAHKSGSPSFRDGYQTSLFFACRVALGLRKDPPHAAGGNGQEPLGEEFTGEDLKWVINRPRLLEIGRDQAVDLSVAAAPSNAAWEIHPPPRDTRSGAAICWLAFYLLLAFAMLVILLVHVSRTVRKLPPIRWLVYTEDDLQAAEFSNRKLLDWVIVFSLLIALAFPALVLCDHYCRPAGEPFSLLTGVSSWPGTTLHLLAALLSLCFLVESVRDLSANAVTACKTFSLPALDKPELERLSWKGAWRELWDRIRTPSQLWKLWNERRQIAIDLWIHSDDPVRATALWSEYIKLGHTFNRMLRCLPLTVTYALFAFALVLLFGMPFNPSRGTLSRWTDCVAQPAGIFLMILLTFFVFDATMLAYRFIRNLADRPSDWQHALEKETNKRGMRIGDMDEWFDIHLIAKRTDAVGKLIYYPFIVLLVLYAARLSYFDNWNWPLSLVVIYAGLALCAVACAVAMRRAAEKSRQSALDRLHVKLVQAEADGQPKQRAEQIKLTIEEISHAREGAFTPFSENPVIGALLIPSGGVTVLALLDMWTISQ